MSKKTKLITLRDLTPKQLRKFEADGRKSRLNFKKEEKFLKKKEKREGRDNFIRARVKAGFTKRQALDLFLLFSGVSALEHFHREWRV